MKTNNLTIYNSLSRQKETFVPLHPPMVGLYVCGPTVYGDGHLGHARPAITFDILVRYLNHLGYKVRYVRNITDVGHLEHDADDGEDKIAKLALNSSSPWKWFSTTQIATTTPWRHSTSCPRRSNPTHRVI